MSLKIVWTRFVHCIVPVFLLYLRMAVSSCSNLVFFLNFVIAISGLPYVIYVCMCVCFVIFCNIYTYFIWCFLLRHKPYFSKDTILKKVDYLDGLFPLRCFLKRGQRFIFMYILYIYIYMPSWLLYENHEFHFVMNV